MSCNTANRTVTAIHMELEGSNEANDVFHCLEERVAKRGSLHGLGNVAQNLDCIRPVCDHDL